MINVINIKSKTLDDCYFQLLEQTYKHGRINHIDSGSFEGHNRLELDCVNAYIEYPSTRPLSPIFPSGMTPVTTDDAISDYFINYLMDNNLNTNEHYKYATWITGGSYKLPLCNIKRKFSTQSKYITIDNDKDIFIIPPNQVQWVIDHYNKVGLHNNHCCIKIGYPECIYVYDIKYDKTSEIEKPSSPCMTLIDTKIVNDCGKNKLLLFVNFRSNDLYSAFPLNIGGIILLGEYICCMLNKEVELGGLFYTSLKCHCYDFQIDFVKKRLNI